MSTEHDFLTYAVLAICFFENFLVELLWVAPEHLRSDKHNGSQLGDIYSFAIVCSEIVTRQNPYYFANHGEGVQGMNFQKI